VGVMQVARGSGAAECGEGRGIGGGMQQQEAEEEEEEVVSGGVVPLRPRHSGK